MKKYLLALLLSVSLISPVSAGQVDRYKDYGTTDEVNAFNLNGNFDNILREVNGGLDNTNTDEDFRLVEIVSTLPLAGDKGRVVYLTTEDIVYVDNGSAWFGTPTYSGTPSQGDVLYFDGTNWVRLTAGTLGNVLKTGGAGADVSWGALNLAGGAAAVTGTLPVANGGTGLASGDFSRTAGGTLTGTYPNPTIDEDKIPMVVFTWSGVDTAAVNTNGMFLTSSQTGNTGADLANPYMYLACISTTYKTMLNFKFKKVAEVTRLKVWVRLWSSNADGAKEALLRVNVGGQTAIATSTTSTTPTWYATASRINVSSLTDGTVYDGIVELANENASTSAYCSAVTIYGEGE